MSKKHFPTNAIQAKGLVWELLQRVEIFLAHSVKQNKEMGKNKQKCMSACIQVLFHLGPSPARFTSYKYQISRTPYWTRVLFTRGRFHFKEWFFFVIPYRFCSLLSKSKAINRLQELLPFVVA